MFPNSHGFGYDSLPGTSDSSQIKKLLQHHLQIVTGHETRAMRPHQHLGAMLHDRGMVYVEYRYLVVRLTHDF